MGKKWKAPTHTHRALKMDAIFHLLAATCARLQMRLSLQMALLPRVFVLVPRCVEVRVTLPSPVEDTNSLMGKIYSK